jgi:hypothetical protein
MEEFELGMPCLQQDTDQLDRLRNYSDAGFAFPAWAKGRPRLSPTAVDLRVDAKKTAKLPRKKVQIGTWNRF